MITYIILLQILFDLVSSCPTLCRCDNDIVSCENINLNTVPEDIPIYTRVLNLSQNHIQSLTQNSFKNLAHLEELHIQDNLISNIHWKTFRSNVRLKLINLMNNNLYDLTPSLFLNNTFLSELDIRNNPRLTYLPYQIIQNAYVFKRLFANTIECGCHMIDWYDMKNRNMDIDITCYNPSDLRGLSLDQLPKDVFQNCLASSNCLPDEFSCDNDRGGVCYSETKLCDGNYDCFDMTDEDCPTENPIQDCSTLDNPFWCSSKDFTDCIIREWVCDGGEDCVDGSDELLCDDNGNEVEESSCATGQYQCRNDRCVDEGVKCDDVNDCGDWSDESKLICGDLETRNVCPIGTIACPGGGMCATPCDGVQECVDRFDELNCWDNCTSKCEEDGRCIQDSWVCDKVPDCNDNSDEANCEYPCGEDEIKCEVGGYCVSCKFACDNFKDCFGGMDERETTCTNCNGSLCLELEQTKSGVTTVVIIATTVSACISITSVILFIVVYRQRKKSSPTSSTAPPLYTEIEHAFRRDIPSSPPPRYKSEPDIAAARLVDNNSDNPYQRVEDI